MQGQTELVYGSMPSSHVCVLPFVCSKNNSAIVNHLEGEGIDFLQFAFRWVNCLLIREVPFSAAIRLWDTYLSEGSRFSNFLVSLAGPRKPSHSSLGCTHSFVVLLFNNSCSRERAGCQHHDTPSSPCSGAHAIPLFTTQTHPQQRLLTCGLDT